MAAARAGEAELERRRAELEARLTDATAELAAGRAAEIRASELEARLAEAAAGIAAGRAAEARASELEVKLADATAGMAAARAAEARVSELETRLADVVAELAASRATGDADRARADAAERRGRELDGQLDAAHARVDSLYERHERALAELRAGMRELGAPRDQSRDQAVVEWAGRLVAVVRDRVPDPDGELKVLLDEHP